MLQMPLLALIVTSEGGAIRGSGPSTDQADIATKKLCGGFTCDLPPVVSLTGAASPCSAATASCNS
jgi:hypothetical protein